MDALQWGNVPEWIGAGAVLGPPMLKAIRRNREGWAKAWPDLVEKLVSLTADQIQHILDHNPEITELAARAWEAASQSAAEEKRTLLAMAVANALTHPHDNVRIDELLFITRTLTVLEPAEVRMLGRVATPRPGIGQFANTLLEGYPTPQDLSKMWPEAADYLGPMSALLVREGLIENKAMGTTPVPDGAIA